MPGVAQAGQAGGAPPGPPGRGQQLRAAPSVALPAQARRPAHAGGGRRRGAESAARRRRLVSVQAPPPFSRSPPVLVGRAAPRFVLLGDGRVSRGGGRGGAAGGQRGARPRGRGFGAEPRGGGGLWAVLSAVPGARCCPPAAGCGVRGSGALWGWPERNSSAGGSRVPGSFVFRSRLAVLRLPPLPGWKDAFVHAGGGLGEPQQGRFWGSQGAARTPRAGQERGGQALRTRPPFSGTQKGDWRL